MKIKKNLLMFLPFGLMTFMLLAVSSCGSKCNFNSITPDTLPHGKITQSYSVMIYENSSCSYTSKSCQLSSGQLPDGITLSGDGLLSGTPTNVGTFNFVILYQVCFSTGAYGATDCSQKTKAFKLVIDN